MAGVPELRETSGSAGAGPRSWADLTAVFLAPRKEHCISDSPLQLWSLFQVTSFRVLLFLGSETVLCGAETRQPWPSLRPNSIPSFTVTGVSRDVSPSWHQMTWSAFHLARLRAITQKTVGWSLSTELAIPQLCLKPSGFSVPFPLPARHQAAPWPPCLPYGVSLVLFILIHPSWATVWSPLHRLPPSISWPRLGARRSGLDLLNWISCHSFT